jgi:hypothetical protein
VTSSVVEFPTRVSLTKFEVASRQLQTAVRLFFLNEDPISIHTLACASREIFERSAKELDKKRAIDGLSQIYPSLRNPAIFSVLNKKRNFFKHVINSPFETIEFDDTENELPLFLACHDCSLLTSPRSPIEIRGYLIWYLMTKTRFDLDKPEGTEDQIANYERWILLIREKYPGIMSDDRMKRKSEGSRVIESMKDEAI